MNKYKIPEYKFKVTYNHYQEVKYIIASHYKIVDSIALFFNHYNELIYSITSFDHIERTIITTVNVDYSVYGSIDLINSVCDDLASSGITNPELFLHRPDIKLIHKVIGPGWFTAYRGVTIRHTDDI